MTKPVERELARSMRAESGRPVRQIAAELGVSVSSVSLWVRDIEITPKQRSRNLARAGQKRGAAWADRHRDRRRLYQEEGRARARADDPLHMAGCMLYWGEGCKARNQARLTNSDPHMLRFFVDFLRQCFQVPDEQMRVRLNFYLGNGLSVSEIEEHWLAALDLPRTCLCRNTINALPTSSSGLKKNKLPYGVCALYVHDTRLLQHIYGAIQEYGDFEEPRWLDGPPRKPKVSPAAEG